jgi:hypothetical protein|tara:strand:- start:83162 stop:83476 length:315 start_codon:yes stop_codon:yes gene_type:complete
MTTLTLNDKLLSAPPAMNPRMALVIKWIKNPSSVSREELVNNANVALADSPAAAPSITTQAAVAAADSIVSAERTTNKVANKKLSKWAFNRAINCVNSYLSAKK